MRNWVYQWIILNETKHSQSITEMLSVNYLKQLQSIISIKRVNHSQWSKTLTVNHLRFCRDVGHTLFSKINVAKTLLFVPHSGHPFLASRARLSKKRTLFVNEKAQYPRAFFVEDYREKELFLLVKKHCIPAPSS